MGLSYGEEIMIVGRTMWTQCNALYVNRNTYLYYRLVRLQYGVSNYVAAKAT